MIAKGLFILYIYAQNSNTMKLLVAIDFSPVTDEIVRYVREMGIKTKPKIWVIHVVQPEPDFVGYEVGPQTERDFIAKKFHEKHIKLQEVAKTMTDDSFPVIPLLLQGPTIKTILEEAERLEANMIVAGSHGHGMMYNILVGSVSNGLLKNSPIPLLIVPAIK